MKKSDFVIEINKIIDCVKAFNIDDALSLTDNLFSYIPEDLYQDEHTLYILNHSRFVALRKQKHSNTINNTDFTVQRNEIILDFIENLKSLKNNILNSGITKINNSRSNISEKDLEKVLLKLNFEKEINLLKEKIKIEKYSTFLIHGNYGYGQEWLFFKCLNLIKYGLEEEMDIDDLQTYFEEIEDNREKYPNIPIEVGGNTYEKQWERLFRSIWRVLLSEWSFDFLNSDSFNEFFKECCWEIQNLLKTKSLVFYFLGLSSLSENILVLLCQVSHLG